MQQLLRNIAEIGAGQGAPQGDSNYCADGTPFVKAINLQELTAGGLISDIQKVSDEVVKTHKLRLYPKGTILFAKSGMSCLKGYIYVLPQDAYVVNHLACITPNEDFSEYLRLYFTFHRPNQLIKDAAYPSISLTDIGNLKIDMKDVRTREHIIKVLNTVEKVVKLRKHELQLLDTLVKARFVEMFGNVNANDKGWDLQPLGNLCTIVRGGSPRPIEQFLGGTVPWIKIGDATEGESIYLNSTKEHIIQEGVKKSRLVKSGSLIFANCGVSLGFARIITFNGCIHDGWLAMEDIDERLNKIFLLQSLNQMTEHFRAIAPAGTQPNLNTAIMKAYMQIIPPMSMQQEFVYFVAQVDKSKVVVQKALNEAQLLFDSLMQEYFG